ncbi:MAG: tetratricopeptide repeat protein [Acidobacteriota bacterium]
MKRKERRKLKSNELSIFLNRTYELAKKRTKQIAIVIGAAVFVFIIFLISRYIKAQNLEKQSQLLAQINNLNQEIYASPERIEDLKELADKGKFTRMGYIYLAKYHIEEGEVDEALNALETIPESRKDIIYYQGQLLKAKALYEKGEIESAFDIYQKIEDTQPRYFSLDIVLFKKAELFAERGDKDKALEIYRKLSEDYPQTYYGYEASQKIDHLEEIK